MFSGHLMLGRVVSNVISRSHSVICSSGNYHKLPQDLHLLTTISRPPRVIKRLFCATKLNSRHQHDSKNKEAGTSKGIKTEKELITVNAFSTAEEYRLSEFYDVIAKNSLFKEVFISEDLDGEVIAFKLMGHDSDKPAMVFVFRKGSTVLWNVPAVQEEQILKSLKSFELKSYPDSFVRQEQETMNFIYNDGKSRVTKNIFNISKSEDPPLAQYSFSNALALSVKLSIWEASLDNFIESIKFVSQDIGEGKRIRLTRDQVFRKTGKLFALRHHINLSSDLLDTPDFYWDRQDLEKLFLQTCSYLNTAKRTKVMNEKLNHCCELMDLLAAHLNDKHHVRLEWMIIILIMVEVVFEVIHYIEKEDTPPTENS